jgi:hypothetical protein
MNLTHAALIGFAILAILSACFMPDACAANLSQCNEVLRSAR